MGRNSRAAVLLMVLALLAGVGSTSAATPDADADPIVFPGITIRVEGEGGVAGFEGGTCTLAFLGVVPGKDGAEDRHYAFTAGHCAVDDGADVVWPSGQGPLVRAGTTTTHMIGRVVYAADRLPALPVDVALIELDDLPIDPGVCFFGGPTGLDTERRQASEVVSYIGKGFPLDARRGHTDDLRSDSVRVAGIVYHGDSGGPVMSEDGAALGIISGVGADTTSGVGMHVIRLDAMLERIRQRTGLDVTIMTAPLTDHAWPADALQDPYGCNPPQG